MAKLLLAATLAAILPAIPAKADVVHGLAARHTKLERVARIRGMDPTGILFASPLAPIGTLLCVSSRRMPEPVCGRVVDICHPDHCAWQLRTGRIVEVQPHIARLLCVDPTGPPRDCPIVLWRE